MQEAFRFLLAEQDGTRQVCPDMTCGRTNIYPPKSDPADETFCFLENFTGDD